MSVKADDDLLQRVVWPFLSKSPHHLGLAVSGGSDSMSLLWLVAPWARKQGIAVSVATVDHGLRSEARAEAEFVARTCADIGLPHAILDWRGWEGVGNLSAAARDARQSLLTAWARDRGIDAIALGHTIDDQAETVLMRLARGSGVDGLAGMSPEREFNGLRWMRPLLSERRETLRDYLRRNGRTWVDDPTNRDDAYDRVKARNVLEMLRPLGIDADGLAATAFRMGLASRSLATYASWAADNLATVQAGDVVFRRAGFHKLPYDTQLRLVADAVRWVGGGVYRPRLIALQDALGNLGLGRRSLQGTLLSRAKDDIRITREHSAVRTLSTPSDQLWDKRWHLGGPHDPSFEIRALGETGIRQCPDWRATGIPRQSLLASPAVWEGDTLIAAPLAGKPNGWTARIITDFHASLLSH